ncbi:MAG: hypothetical protein LBR11_09925 [Deltaproteobacteria bacterium]|jgi:hypothetical protein|nr:hypothetical protein [Deltaproteobacteria bacterium]
MTNHARYLLILVQLVWLTAMGLVYVSMGESQPVDPLAQASAYRYQAMANDLEAETLTPEAPASPAPTPAKPMTSAQASPVPADATSSAPRETMVKVVPVAYQASPRRESLGVVEPEPRKREEPEGLAGFGACPSGQGQGVFKGMSGSYDHKGRYVLFLELEGEVGDYTWRTSLHDGPGVTYVDFAGRLQFTRELYKIKPAQGPALQARLGLHRGFTRVSLTYSSKRAPKEAGVEVYCRPGEVALRYSFEGTSLLTGPQLLTWPMVLGQRPEAWPAAGVLANILKAQEAEGKSLARDLDKVVFYSLDSARALEEAPATGLALPGEPKEPVASTEPAELSEPAAPQAETPAAATQPVESPPAPSPPKPAEAEPAGAKVEATPPVEPTKPAEAEPARPEPAGAKVEATAPVEPSPAKKAEQVLPAKLADKAEAELALVDEEGSGDVSFDDEIEWIDEFLREEAAQDGAIGAATQSEPPATGMYQPWSEFIPNQVKGRGTLFFLRGQPWPQGRRYILLVEPTGEPGGILVKYPAPGTTEVVFLGDFKVDDQVPQGQVGPVKGHKIESLPGLVRLSLNYDPEAAPQGVQVRILRRLDLLAVVYNFASSASWEKGQTAALSPPATQPVKAAGPAARPGPAATSATQPVKAASTAQPVKAASPAERPGPAATSATQPAKAASLAAEPVSAELVELEPPSVESPPKARLEEPVPPAPVVGIDAEPLLEPEPALVVPAQDQDPSLGQGSFGKFKGGYDEAGRYILEMEFDGQLGQFRVNTDQVQDVVATYIDFLGDFKFSQEVLRSPSGRVLRLRLGRHPGFTRLSLTYRTGQGPREAQVSVELKDSRLVITFEFVGQEKKPAA